jgi:hypothetical protein
MKIIKRGIPPQDRVWKGTCSVCGTVAEATGQEMNDVTTDFYGDTYSRESCPVCGSNMYFYEEKEQLT